MALVLDGVVFGLQLALLGVGLTLIYGLGGVLNLAHGQAVVIGAIAGAVSIAAGAPVPLALGVVILAAAVFAWVLDATLMRPVYRLTGERRVLLSLLLTLGVAFLVDGILITSYPFTALSLAVPLPAIEVLGVRMRSGSLVASALALVTLLGLFVWLRFTRFGRAVRSMIQDEDGAALCGVNLSLTRTVVFVLSGVVAGMVAITQSLGSSVGATAGLDLTILALIVAVVGGLGRVSGALVAGLVLGIVHAVASFYIGAFVTFVILLAVAMLAIVVRPAGIVGRAA